MKLHGVIDGCLQFVAVRPSLTLEQTKGAGNERYDISDRT
jgi:hypothetical protein